MESSPYGAVYLSPPPDNSWRRSSPTAGFLLLGDFVLSLQDHRTTGDVRSWNTMLEQDCPFLLQYASLAICQSPCLVFFPGTDPDAGQAQRWAQCNSLCCGRPTPCHC
ncbi:hypothetical protein ATANTOWER_029964 [Ataeniobius toweri]|uniref:Uncharacterized protein n=1 Tax=Ataeniobius toweri TaxID=208326 RepID=A0ABU7AWU1_9TELE|nr:hypothetical protein [Ataeniobius toweri]